MLSVWGQLQWRDKSCGVSPDTDVLVVGAECEGKGLAEAADEVEVELEVGVCLQFAQRKRKKTRWL